MYIGMLPHSCGGQRGQMCSTQFLGLNLKSPSLQVHFLAEPSGKLNVPTELPVFA